MGVGIGAMILEDCDQLLALGKRVCAVACQDALEGWV
jgi:hypothetical protein